MKVLKAAAQVLNTLWQYRDLRTIYKKVRREGFRPEVGKLRPGGHMMNYSIRHAELLQ